MKFLTFIAILALIWVIGLFAFADRVRGLAPAPEPDRADAIVALTGPSAERVNAAIRPRQATPDPSTTAKLARELGAWKTQGG